MQRRPFGPTGVEVSVVGQGTWNLRDAESAAGALRRGLDLGLNHIDTAELYRGSEAIVARAVRGRRDDAFLVSKVLPQNASFDGTKAACRSSLERLGVDALDAYLLHWWSGAHPIEDTMRAMGELVDDGRVRFVGVSNLEVDQVEAAQSAFGKRPGLVCNQVYYDLEHRHAEAEIIPYCRERGMAVVAYSPFGSGDGAHPAGRGKGAGVVEAIAGRHDASVHQVVLAFLTRHENVFAIPKAERTEHVEANAAASKVRLADADVEAIDAAFPLPRRVSGLPMV